MLDKRPKNLNLMTIRFPLPAIVSILHRVSGFVLFLLIPMMLYCLNFSLSPDGFYAIQAFLDLIWVKIMIWLFMCAFFYHVIAGIRHLLADLHWGDTLKAGQRAAILCLIFSMMVAIILGIWLW